MRASAAGKIADPSSAASLENNWIVSAIGPSNGSVDRDRLDDDLQATWRFRRRGEKGRGDFGDETIGKEVAAKGSFLLDDSNESSKRVYANLKWNGIEESKIFATFFYAVFLT